jgi:hypothetical protein
MNTRKFCAMLASIAALASSACTATSDGLELELVNHEEPAAVICISQGNDVDARGERMPCRCMLEKAPSGMSGGSEDGCPITHGMANPAR